MHWLSEYVSGYLRGPKTCSFSHDRKVFMHFLKGFHLLEQKTGPSEVMEQDLIVAFDQVVGGLNFTIEYPLSSDNLISSCKK